MVDFLAYSEQYAKDTSAACTNCGKCAAVCPVVRESPLAEIASEKLTQGLIELSVSGTTHSGTHEWLNICNSSGLCNDVCPEGLNIRSWITSLKTLESVRNIPEKERKKSAGEKFRALSQAVRLLASMQLPPELIHKIHDTGERPEVDVVFYTGCNVLRTPHIVMNAMGILDRIGIEYDVMGGASHCCGVTQHRSGDVRSYERVAGRTSAAFTASKAKDVIAWCPTCLIQFNENWSNFENPDYSVSHITRFLHKHLDRLSQAFVEKPKRRIVIQEHVGIQDVVEHVNGILGAIPFIEIVQVPQNRQFGYVCGGMVPQHHQTQENNYKLLLDGAQKAGVDYVVTVYHSCQRALSGASVSYPFKVVNFTDILAYALELPAYVDVYGELAKVENLEAVIGSVHSFLKINGVQLTHDQIELIAQQMFGEPGFFGSQDDFVAKMSSYEATDNIDS